MPTTATNADTRPTRFVICHAVRGRTVVAVVATCIVVLVISSVIAWDGAVPDWDRR